MAQLRIGVVYGGRSREHEVSLASAASVISHLDPSKYEPVPIRIDRDGRWFFDHQPPTATSAEQIIKESSQGHDTVIDPQKPYPSGVNLTGSPTPLLSGLELDVVFPVLHGPYGEDGTVQGLLEMADIPYVGAGVLASAVGIDKAFMKQLFAAKGLPQVLYMVVLARTWKADTSGVRTEVAKRLGLPVFVKPANLGSSVGISKVSSTEQLDAAIELAFAYDRKIIIEKAVPDARDIECAILGNDETEVSVPGEVIASREFYDYEAKYLDDSSELCIPAALDPATIDQVRQFTTDAFHTIECSGMARVDFLIARATGQLFINEINTIPGFTTISMYAKLWASSGITYSELLDRLVQLALDRHAVKSELGKNVP